MCVFVVVVVPMSSSNRRHQYLKAVSIIPVEPTTPSSTIDSFVFYVIHPVFDEYLWMLHEALVPTTVCLELVDHSTGNFDRQIERKCFDERLVRVSFIELVPPPTLC